MSPVDGFACGAATVLVLVVGVGAAMQRTGDRWREYGAHKRATPVMRRKAMRETGENLKVFVLAAAIVAVVVAIMVTKK